MSALSHRQRSTTATSIPPPDTESASTLRVALEELSTTLHSSSNTQSALLSRLIPRLKAVRQCLVNTPESARGKETFRHLHGFSVVLDTLRAASGYYHPAKMTLGEKEKLFELLAGIFGLLSEVFRNHHGNRRYFKMRVEGGGWVALEQAIASIGFGGNDPDTWSENQLFSSLLAFAIDDEKVRSLCQDVQLRHGTPDFKTATQASKNKNKTDAKALYSNAVSPLAKHSELAGDRSVSESVVDTDLAALMKRNIQTILTQNTLLVNKDISPTIVGFWKTLPRGRSLSDAPATLAVILTLSRLASLSKFNLLALHSTGILSTLLQLAFGSDVGLASCEREAVERLCISLASLGVSTLSDARHLLISTSSRGAEFLLQTMKLAQSPPHIHFDLSLNGFASIELPTLGRSFPPSSSLAGYTFTAWIHIDQFDVNAHTTIFGAFDSSQTCFVLAYLERDTHNFILQTSVTSSRPSVRFKSTVFKEKRWYHIAIVHRRPRTITSSKAALYVDGEFAEQVKCQYPASPPTLNSSTDSMSSFASSPSSSKTNPVQAFLGTPQDLSTQLGQGMVFSRWSLASAYLLEDALSDDLLAVHYRLGPRYNGNFQDCLGSFQTYEASAGLGMRNELMHPGKDEKSDILTAIREKASILMPESHILLSVLPSAVLGDETRGEGEPVQLIRGLSRSASSNLFQLTRNGTSIAVNAAIPSINEALNRANGTAVLTGNPVVIVPQSLDDAMWRLGGCVAPCLKLVADASTRENIVRGVEILFESVKGNWRNSEAMERENGYAILGALIRGKVGAGPDVSTKTPKPEGSLLNSSEREKLSFELLSLVLAFVGYNHEFPEDCVINNPLAYRILLVDFDMWRKTAIITQRLYYKQFVTFGVSSKYHVFNSRRLLRMRIVKRFLDALKGEIFLPAVFPSFLEAFVSLVKCNLSAEVFRSLALFITYALHKPAVSASRTPMSKHATVSSRSTPTQVGQNRLPTELDIKQNPDTPLTKQQVGARILEMYTDLLCEKGSTAHLKKFARTVTNKWLLHLLTEDDPQVVVLGTKILARLLVINGASYVLKFTDKTGGFVIMRYRLKRWWDIPTLWPICFSILFNHDVADIDYERPFELFSLLETFGKSTAVYPNMLPVIIGMLQQGLNSLLHNQDDPDSPLRDRTNGHDQASGLKVPTIASRRRSMSLTKELEARRMLYQSSTSTVEANRFTESQKPTRERLGGQATVLHTVIRFFADLHTKSQDFKDFTMSSDYVRLLLGVLYPVIVSADTVSPETELNSRDSALTFEGDDVIIRPISRISSMPAPIVRTSTVETHLGVDSSQTSNRAKPLRRGSSFILLTARPSEFSPSTARLNGVMTPKARLAAHQISHSIVQELLELVVNVFIDQVLLKKEFPGFGLFLKVPPGFQEHQAYFESFVLRNTISQLNNTVQLDQKLLWEPKVITNMARFSVHMGEAVYEGWFLGGAEPLLDFCGSLLEYLQRPEIARIKSVRLCSQAVTSIQTVFLRVALLRLSEIDDSQVTEREALDFMDKLLYWQTILLSSESREDDFLKLICYQLYAKLVDSREKIRSAASNLWRILLVQKPDETSAILAIAMDKKQLIAGFKKLMELDNETFVAWVDEHRIELDALFFGAMSKSWEHFVGVENIRTEETAKTRVAKRKDRLKQWQAEALNEEDILFRHDLASSLWMKNIYASEHIKYQRAMQDQQDNLAFLASSFSKMQLDLYRPCAIFDDGSSCTWKLDRTEGRNRMRLRMLPDRVPALHDYQPKRRVTESVSQGGLKVNTKIPPISAIEAGSNTPVKTSSAPLLRVEGPHTSSESGSVNEIAPGQDTPQENVLQEEDFEIVDDPNDQNEGEDVYEDKNRKVMRSLQRGDQVQHVFNISRIIGLEACEGLLIIGKDSLYLMDNFFQRSDGEILNVWQAPAEERDPYLQMISGQKTSEKRPQLSRADQDSRSWKWNDVLSISKRRFLFRDVAIELFFTDGRSYLLTTISQLLRDDLFSKLASKAPATSGSSLPSPEDAWRLEALRVPDEVPVSLGSKFGNIFNSSAWNPAMRRWAKGEISNFHYLMLVNTMAGRTFNDLTQYPVFPWVLADYTSEELDLDNPESFRDLSKPMGAQHAGRQADFVERYKSFAEMGDQPPFHYGTHYSSAMIVTSYLIRLQPFVQSYLLLQGGNFDHPDRLFYSIEKAWTSASQDNMTDVRELIPEFFYLPEFLTNSNGFNFGMRQGSGGSIDTVVLPPWAKGDPKIFVAKHREALESPHVSQHLHQWIDLVFGSKQRGEAAVENTNVFHHLSYHGAKNLDNIEDPHERLATIGIIHNFGQTPHQVFSRPHQPREHTNHKLKRLDTSAESLTRLPFPLLENHETVKSLIHSSKLDRLLCATAFRLNMPPYHDKYMEWGYADNSIRFFTTDSKKELIGLFENLHLGQLSCAAFADSRILVTAGVDCVISVWSVTAPSSKQIELQPKTSLFGHKYPASTIAISRTFSTILSASTDGQVLLWDLNRLEFVRKLAHGRQVECAQINDVSGDIMLCRGQKVALYTLNGELLVDQNLCTDHDDYIFSCAFYEGTGNEWLECTLIFTGHRRGVVNVWKKCVKDGKWALSLVKRLDHTDQRAEDGSNIGAAITCITPMPQAVYTGDEDGRVYEWDCVQRER